MNEKYVTEKPFELLEQAQADVSVIFNFSFAKNPPPTH